jgi:hypothetical protein
MCSFWAFATFLVMFLVVVLQPGPGSQYWISRNMEWVLFARAITTVAMNVAAIVFFVKTGSDRAAVLRYSKYMIAIYTALAISRGCQLSTELITANFGEQCIAICVITSTLTMVVPCIVDRDMCA